MPSPTMLGQPHVLSMGEALIDLIVVGEADSLEVADDFVARPGGAPANVAVALSRLGMQSAFCGVVGDDPFGRRISAGLIAEGVDVSRLRQSPEAATTLAFAWKDAHGSGHFWLLRGADALLAPDDVAAAGITQVAALVIGSVSLAAQPSRTAVEEAVDVARLSGVPVVFDVNLRPTLWHDLSAARAICASVAARSTLLKLSLDDARGLMGTMAPPEEAIAHALSLGPALTVLTDGERGCWFASRDGDDVIHVAAFTVDAVEPTGAGDAFTAALICRLIRSGWAPFNTKDLRFAAAAGALATTHHGAWQGLPTRDQLEAFLERA